MNQMVTGARIWDWTPRQVRRAWAADGRYDDLDLYTALVAMVGRQGDRVAVIDEHATATYGGILAVTHRVAAALEDCGVQRDAVVALQLPNRWESVAVEYAVAALGAVALPFPITYGAREMGELLRRSAATACVTVAHWRGRDQAGVINSLRPTLPNLRSVFAIDEEVPGLIGLGSVLDGDADPGWALRAVDPDGPCRISVTSGTEAFPKMVVNSHNCVGRPYQELWAACGIGDESTVLVGPPLGSGMGQIVTSALLARLGATVALMDAFTPATALRQAERSQATHWWLVPTMAQLMLSEPSVAAVDLSRTETVICSGSPVPEAVRQAIASRSWRCLAAYGFVDGGLCAMTVDDDPGTAGLSVGRPDPRVNEIAAFDAGGRRLGPGAVGELRSRGPFSPLGYLGSLEANADYRDEEGWVRSGDLGVVDAHGFLQVVGRSKDVIVRGGLNISPAEVEEYLVSHPAIVQAACVGYPDQVMGERVCAFVVLRDGAEPLGLGSLRAYLEERQVMRAKTPERLIVANVLPTNPAGKVLKRALRDLLAGDADRSDAIPIEMEERP